jgi:hypothetical protein
MLVVFHDTRLGGSKDLWVAEVDAMGRILGPGDFLGGDAGEPLRASVEGGTLTIERTSPPGSVQFELAELRRDTDGDGLPDVVERRIRTDPSLQDTDGDGLIDSKDSAPNGAALPASEEQDIVRAVFQQYFTFKDAADHDLAVMVSEFPLQWLGRQGPTITLTPRQDSEFIEEAGLDGVAHISIAPGWHERGRDEDPDQELAVAADERRYRLTSYRGGLNAVGYDITVRRLGRRWLIKECTMAWIS